MKTFTDTTGRAWSVVINVTSIKRVRDLIDVNLLEVAEKNSDLLGRLCDDPVTMCDVLYCLCKPEADAAGVSDLDFGAAMGGDTLDYATDALLGELVDFFPQGRRALLQKILEKTRLLQTRLNEMATRALDDPELTKAMEQKLLERFTELKKSIGSATSWLGSAESTQDLARSAS